MYTKRPGSNPSPPPGPKPPPPPNPPNPKRLTQKDLDNLTIRVATATGELAVLSVYFGDDGKTVWVDVE